MAALLILGAAVYAAAQSGVGGRPNAGKRPAASAEKGGKDGREQPPAAAPEVKRNARGDVTLPAALKIGAPADGVRYSYEFTQPQFFIRHILIYHDGEGRGKISFERKDDTDPIVDPIELSPRALARIKALWEALRFMDSNQSYQSERQYPHLGTMRLAMTLGGGSGGGQPRTRVAEFNWTKDPSASALVAEYRRAADQAIFVFNITVARENQPLEAPDLMDELGKLYKRDGLSDPQQLVPLLRELTDDERIPLIARNQAARLLKQFEK